MMDSMSDDCVFEIPARPRTAPLLGQRSSHSVLAGVFASPQAHIQVEEILGLGLQCVMRWRYDWETRPVRGHARS